MGSFTRRDFLNLSVTGFASLAIKPLSRYLPPDEEINEPIGKGRVTVAKIGVYEQPDLKSERLRDLNRDEIVNLFEAFESPHGPPLNPRWYRVVGGYAHSAYIQRVDDAHQNQAQRYIPSYGRLGEVTVPFTQSFQYTGGVWEPVYRLYYQSVHWVVAVETGPDDKPWYRLKDELLRVEYAVPAAHIQLLGSGDFSPISPDVPPQEKRIEVSLLEQRLIAYERERVVLDTKVSSGMPNLGPVIGLPTDTPRGSFKIDPKVPSKHMGDGRLTADLHAYELPGVPWVCFFEHSAGIALHGTYWHDNFGARMSHGCVNLRVEDAKWIYRWSMPVAKSTDWTRSGRGTRVDVF
jgi:lipoprotein-anchoring transpeptidase ErfK/SrfK